MARTSKRRTSRRMRRNDDYTSRRIAAMSDEDSQSIARHRVELQRLMAFVLSELQHAERGADSGSNGALSYWVEAYRYLIMANCKLQKDYSALGLSREEYDFLADQRDALFMAINEVAQKRFGLYIVDHWDSGRKGRWWKNESPVSGARTAMALTEDDY